MNVVPATPKEVDGIVLDFCEREVKANERPVFIPVRPVAGAKPQDCKANVEKKISVDGGRIEYGWIIWLAPRWFIEAEHHGTWISPKGERVDVSPHDEDRILFLPGAEPFKHAIANQSIHLSLSNDPKVAQWLDVRGKIDKYEVEHVSSDGILEATPELLAMESLRIQLEMEIFSKEPEALPLSQIVRPGDHVGRNERCPCGSGKKYKHCCMRK